MSFRHTLDRFLGGHDSARRTAFDSLMWALRVPAGDWFDAPKRRLLRQVRPFTMVSYRRLANVYELCLRAALERVGGAFVECGVWKGGAAAVMACLAREEGARRRTWLFDSFEGLPEPSAEDGAEARRYSGGRDGGKLQPIGKCAASVEEVERFLFSDLEFDPALVSLRKGWFQDTLPAARAEIGPIALLRLDGDWYESNRVCLENLYDGVVPGGFVILDDYFHWEGCRRATDEFLAKSGGKAEIRRIDGSGAWFRKPVAI